MGLSVRAGVIQFASGNRRGQFRQKMYFNIPVIDAVLSHRGDPFPFCDLIEKQIELFTTLEEKEEDLCNNIFDYAHQYQITAYYYPGPAMQRRGLRMIMTAFQAQKDKLLSFKTLLPESAMEPETHQNYLQTVALTEVLGNLILNPYKIKIDLRYCPSCDPYFIEPDPSVATAWGLKVVRRIDIPAYDRPLKYVFGQYDPTAREFI